MDDYGYPPGWPRCACGLPVLDGHLTCGNVGCNEARARYDAGLPDQEDEDDGAA